MSIIGKRLNGDGGPWDKYFVEVEEPRPDLHWTGHAWVASPLLGTHPHVLDGWGMGMGMGMGVDVGGRGWATAWAWACTVHTYLRKPAPALSQR